MGTVRFCLDFGNTRKKLGYFQGDLLINEITLRENTLEHIHELVTKHQPAAAILSSDVTYDPAIDDFLSEHTNYIKLTHETKLPFLNAYGSPTTLGRDRIAMVAGLSKFYPGENALAISIGTCITYSFLAKNNAFRGGAISPGIHLRLKSLNDYTDNLPLISSRGYDSLMGFDTETSIRSGVLNGMTSEIDGMIERFEEQYGKVNAVLTGGDTRYFARQLKKKIFADEFFVLKGLYAILEYHDA
jgi:type III pantothenate kinase